MAILSNNLGANNGQKGQYNYECKDCDYICSKKYAWERHLMTSKHGMATKKGQNGQLFSTIYTCEICDKEYKDRSGLWRHKQKCCLINNDEKLNNKNELISTLLKQNAELIKVNSEMIKTNSEITKTNSDLIKEHADIKQLILEICKNGVNNTNNDCYNTINTTNNTNSNNKAFNLHFYLNETCKNAMNLSEFIDSINPQLSDLISIGELGYVDGISKIIVDNLNKLDFTERPVNCTDKKRETMYIKDDDIWERDDENKKLNKAVKKVAYKNTKNFNKFKEKYPDYGNSDSVHSDQYSKIVIESLKDDRENNEKVIKNISKVTTIKEK